MILFLLITNIILIGIVIWSIKKNQANSNNLISGKEKDRMIDTLKDKFMVEMKTEVNDNTLKMFEKLNDLEKKINTDFYNFNESVQGKLDNNINTFRNNIESKLENNINKLSETVAQGTVKTSETFNKLNERLIQIDASQENIMSLSSNILSLQDILNNTKKRGVLGETLLYQVLHGVYGDNDTLYSTQYRLKSGLIPDSILFAPKPLGNICIDAKFPLENFKKLHDENLENSLKEKAKREFITNVKKHIDDIANKYIVDGETSEQAIMFIPSESVFAELYNEFYEKIIEHAYKKKVWIASPTTLIALLGLLQGVTRDIKVKENADIILKELKGLSIEFERFNTRWNELSKNIDKLTSTSKDLGITTNKIIKKFSSINDYQDN